MGESRTESRGGKSRALLEVSFSGEAGSGFGPTLEFYTVISREFQKADLAMWYGKETTKEEDADGTSTEYIHCPFGLFPRALLPSSTPSSSLLLHFRLLGRLLAQSLSDSRLFDLPLSPVFLHFLSSPSPFPCVSTSAHLSLLHQLDPHLFTSLHNLSLTPEEDFLHLETSFTLPGEESFELLQGGSRKQVTKHNVKQFIQLVSFWLLSGGVSAQFHALRSGFSQLLDPSLLCIFGPAELDELFCGCGSSQSSQKNWSPTAIAQAIKPDHGYSHDSPQIKWLVSQLNSFDREQQRNFVQFVTGSPRLPVGGFSALSPPLTVARKSSAEDSELPSAMTCLNYLKTVVCFINFRTTVVLSSKILMLYLIALFFVLAAYYIRKFYDDVNKYPKGPTPLPLAGNLLTFPKDAYSRLHEVLSELSDKYGPVYTIFLPRPYVIITDFHLIKEALATKGDDFVGRSGLFPDRINMLDSTNGGVLISMEDCLHHLDSLYAKSDQIDMRWPIQLFVGNVINQTLFGYHYPYDKCERFVQFVEAFNNQIACIRDSKLILLAQQYPWIRYIPYIGWKAVRRLEGTSRPMMKHVEEDVQQSLKSYDPNSEPECFIHAYQKMIDKGVAEEINNQQMKMVAIDFFVAGMETTSTTLRWAMLFMADNQQAQDKVRKEIHEVFGTDRQPNFKERANMPYTNATIQEIQRLCNLVAQNVIHRTTKDTSVGKYFIPNDTLIMAHLSHVLWHSPVYKDPKKFMPERFLMEDGVTPNMTAVEQCIPFSIGKRICAGEGLARLELFIGLVSILQRYKIEPLPGKKVDTEPIFSAILIPKQQKLKLTKLI
ncbi:hypothetical protein WR25_10689 [Diploscapter pachys]|uniref:HECT domain-containing protein n=1 Tax=Diploscapter pachys TaxID=2018661 RepID=A0A2A2LJR8_9BILA|nr:hypothetical protein WR25_10689 [Diploscapter pachys]